MPDMCALYHIFWSCSVLFECLIDNERHFPYHELNIPP